MPLKTGDLGFTVGAFIVLRLLRGFAGPAGMKFRNWLPLDARRWGLVIDDLRCLRHWRVPERSSHEGIAGLVQAFGLALFAWMAVSGISLFAIDTFGISKSLFRSVKELHEIGETLVPVFLAMHVGAVILFDGGPLQGEDGLLDIDRIRLAVLSRLHLVPRFRQRVAYVPYERNPVWVDDHRAIRRTTDLQAVNGIGIGIANPKETT